MGSPGVVADPANLSLRRRRPGGRVPPGFTGGTRPASGAVTAPAPVLVDRDRGDEDHADEDVLVQRVDVDDLQPVVDLREEDGAEGAAGDGAGAAEQRGAADDHRGEDLER